MHVYMAYVLVQVEKHQRYRFSVLVTELRNHDNVASYSATVLALINCIIIASDSVEERVRMRNEFIGQLPF